MKLNYAVLAVTPETGAMIEELKDFAILATTWYEKLPSKEDIKSLYDEYRTDKELGMVEIDFVLVWREDEEFNNNLRETLKLPKEFPKEIND